MCTDLRDNSCDRKDWVLTHSSQFKDGGLPKTIGYLLCKCSLREESVIITGHLSAWEFANLIGCAIVVKL